MDAHSAGEDHPSTIAKWGSFLVRPRRHHPMLRATEGRFMNGRRHGERGGRLARVAMCLGLAGALAVFMVGSGARAFERPAGVVAKSAPAPVWRTIALGTRKGVDGYRDALEAASMKIGDDADEILGRPAFPYASARIEHELVVLSVARSEEHTSELQSL